MKTEVIDFGKGMEHLKKIACKSITLINSSYSHGNSDTIKIPFEKLK